MTRELTVDEAIAFAIALQRDGQLDAAAELYRQVFVTEPDHPHALHYAGVLAHQRGCSEDAIALIEKSVALVPERADFHNNLGIVFESAGRREAAAAAYERSIALDPGHANAYSNLGVLLRAAGRPVEAESAYRRAIELNPHHVDAYTNLGILLSGLNRTQEAAACYSKVITLRPSHAEARRLRALAHCMLGEIDEAVTIFEEWLQQEPGDPIATHMLAACSGRDVPARASDAFVERTFDGFAASFESKLEQLSYRAPALVASMVGKFGLEPVKELHILDAGCGTGLCGPLLSPYARKLVGVDLSEKMLAHARSKNVYDELVRAELTAHLDTCTEAFDLVVSADALVYFGDLRRVIASAAAALRPAGRFIFTLERAPQVEEVDYRLELHGRYSHDERYVTKLLRSAGLQAEVAHAELRMESGVPVAGLIISATRVDRADR